MSALWDLLIAVAQGWVSLMSGLVGLAMTIYGLWKRRELSGGVFLAFGTISLVVALAMTWTAEHQTAEETKHKLAQANQKLADLTKPQFVLVLPDIAYRYSELRLATIVLLGVEIINKGADSAVLFWRASYQMPTLSREVEIVRLPDRPPFFSILLPDQRAHMIFQGSAAINLQTAPIPRGGVRTGRLPLRIPGNQVEEIRIHRPRIAIAVQDYTGTQYSVDFNSSGVRPPNIRVYPGEELVPAQESIDSRGPKGK
jgi:hypothetical protein